MQSDNTNKQQYHLIAFDMDGTLLDSTKQIRRDSLEAIHEAAEAGKVVSLSTGRCLPELRVYEEQLKDVPYYICMSGALVYSNKEKRVIHTTEIDPELVGKILSITESEDLMIHLLSWESIVEAGKVERSEQYHMASYKANYEACSILPENLREWYRENTCPIFKLNLYCRDLEQRDRMEAAIAGFGLELAYSEETNLECSPPGVSKAEGLRRLCIHTGVDMSETIAVGDADNDTAILKAAGLSVAMANASPQIKEIADLVTLSCDEGGCAEVIRRFLLSQL
ncbi:MAG: HAD family hydrolase [Lachnospiraceae bacterium]|nr:HAD family hydrolase [Lachnospiraceae bacterium]